MRLAILSCGALVVSEKENTWLFGAPETVRKSLDESGIEVPDYVFTTNLRAPGVATLGKPTMRFKEQPLRMNGLKATPIDSTHGSDYIIESDQGKVLFSERGDVSVKETEGYDLAIIKNTHYANGYGEHVIRWPWPDTEYIIQDKKVTPLTEQVRLKVWSSLDDVPGNLKSIGGVPLTLDQTNFIARVAKSSADGPEENWAVGIAAFKKAYKKENGKWARRNADSKTKSLADDTMDDILEAGGKLDDIISIAKSKSEEDAHYVNFGDWAEENTIKAVKSVLGKNVEYDYEAPPDKAKYDIVWQHSARKMMEYEKLSQDKAKYKATAGKDAGIEVCANCKYYSKDMTCHKVEGDIAPTGVCVLWKYPDHHKKEEYAHSLMEIVSELDSNELKELEVSIEAAKAGEVDAKEGEESSLKEIISELTEEELKELEEVLAEAKKELVENPNEGKKPVKRFGDVMTAALHTAYNDVSDFYFNEGYLSQDERMQVGGTIGKALSAFRDNLPEELMTRDVTYSQPVPRVFKEYAPVPDTIEEDWFSVYKNEETGEDRWVSVSSVAAWDRQNEFFSTKAMDWAIKFSNVIGDKGPLRFKHIPGLDGGVCDTQVRIGDFLLESGTFRDNSVGLAMKELLRNTPEDWQMSVGLAYAKNDIEHGYYKRAAIFERSMTRKPALPITTITLRDKEFDMKIPTELELKEAADELGMDVADITILYERALANGQGPLSLKEFKEVALKTSGLGGANATHNRDDDDEDEKTLKEIISELDEEDFKELEELVLETKQEMEEEDEEDEDESKKGKGKMPYKSSKEDERLNRLESIVEQQSASIMEQTKALTSLASAMAGGNQVNEVGGAVQDFLSGLPRRKANSFVGQQTKQEESNLPDDNEISARLKQIETHLKSVQPAGTDIYNLFTSTELNNKGRG